MKVVKGVHMKDEAKTRLSLIASILIFMCSAVMREMGYRAMALVLFLVALFEIIALFKKKVSKKYHFLHFIDYLCSI